MNVLFYKATCLTNLHMGSGDVNYDVIDLEVERDPVLGEPTMNASGVKGALRDHCEELNKKNEDNKEFKHLDIGSIFGNDAKIPGGTTKGNYYFLSGDLLARPVRVSNGSASYILATTPELLNHVGRKLEAFGKKNPFVNLPATKKNTALTGGSCAEIEGFKAEKVSCKPLDDFFKTSDWAIMTPDDLKSIDLPVMAHNVLEDGTSKNLWYEQYVPHESVFGIIIIAPDGDKSFEDAIADKKNAVVQFGAGKTTGNGFTKLEKLEV